MALYKFLIFDQLPQNFLHRALLKTANYLTVTKINGTTTLNNDSEVKTLRHEFRLDQKTHLSEYNLSIIGKTPLASAKLQLISNPFRQKYYLKLDIEKTTVKNLLVTSQSSQQNLPSLDNLFTTIKNNWFYLDQQTLTQTDLNQRSDQLVQTIGRCDGNYTLSKVLQTLSVQRELDISHTNRVIEAKFDQTAFDRLTRDTDSSCLSSLRQTINNPQSLFNPLKTATFVFTIDKNTNLIYNLSITTSSSKTELKFEYTKESFNIPAPQRSHAITDINPLLSAFLKRVVK